MEHSRPSGDRATWKHWALDLALDSLVLQGDRPLCFGLARIQLGVLMEALGFDVQVLLEMCAYVMRAFGWRVA